MKVNNFSSWMAVGLCKALHICSQALPSKEKTELCQFVNDLGVAFCANPRGHTKASTIFGLDRPLQGSAGADGEAGTNVA